MKQAIILAAGLGSRLKEVTKVTPKPLIAVNNQPIIERNIEFMIEAGIERIVIVLGYMKDKFIYLKEKYKNIDIEFVYNAGYKEYNTIYSLFCAKEYLNCSTYITTADIYLKSNLYLNYTDKNSFYILKRHIDSLEKEEWAAKFDDNKRIFDVEMHSYSGNTYTGISFWNTNDANFIKSKLSQIDWSNNNFKKKYWDEILLNELNNICVYAKILDNNDEIYEIDDMDDLNSLKAAMKIKISYQNICKRFGTITLFNNINFDILNGEIFVLVGPSGSGKSTLLKMINKMVLPDCGTIVIDDKDVSTLDTLELRRNMGYMMQKVGLFPHMNCFENIVLPFELKKEQPDLKYIEYLIGKMDLDDATIKKDPSQLSGGEKQRLGLVRALAGKPNLVLMDEPFSALDPVIRRVLQDLIIDLHQELNITFVFVTHDMNEALKIANRICFVKDGIIQQIGTPNEIINHPKNDFVREFFRRGE